MLFRRHIRFLFLSITIVVLVWVGLMNSDFGSLSRDWSLVHGGSELTIDAVLVFLLLFALSLFARALRYRYLARATGGDLRLICAFRAITLGRLVTLITPTALFGGQPVAYYCVAVERSPREAGGVVLTATFLDICFFVLWAPVVLWQATRLFSETDDVTYALYATTVVYVLVGVVIWLVQSPRAQRCVEVAAKFWSIIPSWNEGDLRRTFSRSVRQLRTYLRALKMLNRNAWGAVITTFIGFVSTYIGVWWLLASMGCFDGVLDSVGNQLVLNFAATIVSPGLGTGPTEAMFPIVFSRWAGVSSVLHVLVFMSASYWVHVVLGLFVWFTYQRDDTLVTFEFGDDLVAANPPPERIIIEVLEEGAAVATPIQGAVCAGAEFVLRLPAGTAFRWRVEDPQGHVFGDDDNKMQGEICCDGLIRRSFLGRSGMETMEPTEPESPPT